MVSISSDSVYFGDEEQDFDIKSYYSNFESNFGSKIKNLKKKHRRSRYNLKKKKEDEKFVGVAVDIGVGINSSVKMKKPTVSSSLQKIIEEHNGFTSSNFSISSLQYSSFPFEYSFNLDKSIESILNIKTNEKKFVIRLNKNFNTPFETTDIFDIFKMINRGYSYFHFDYSQVDIYYVYMFKLYNKLKLEHLRTSRHNIYYWNNIWYNISEICYNLCIKHQTFVANSFSGKFILSWAILNIDKFKFGRLHDIICNYMFISGSYPYSIKYIYNGYSVQSSQREFFNRLAQYTSSNSIHVQIPQIENLMDSQPFPPIDLSFIF
jgi:hypothetical protein